MSGKMDISNMLNTRWILVCTYPHKGCHLGLATKDAEKQRGVCYNCRYSKEIPEQEYAGLGRM